MSKKLFTLIKGDKVHFAPGTKIIPAELFSELLSSSELLKKVQEDAAEYKLGVVSEAEKLKEAAEQEGFQLGLEQWADHVVKLEEEIGRVQKDMTDTIIPVALKAAKKIIGRELEISEDAVVDIVINNLKAVAHHKKIKIHVNKQDLITMEKNKEKLKKNFEQLETLLIVESEEVKPGGAIIETEGGIINAQLDNLILILEKAFETFMKQDTKV
ncbi:MAG: Yop proteins translocation protein L [Chlamydiae bacterium]|nr:Yop proteins translocation protein L [Chlamydiota bacterium]